MTSNDNNRLAANEAFLRLLHSAHPEQRRQLIKTAAREQILSVCECAHNILESNVILTPKQLDKLRTFRKFVRTVVDRKISISAKKTKLQHSGGFLPTLLEPIIESLTS